MEGVKTSNMFPCLLPKVGQTGSLDGVRVGVSLGVLRGIGLGGLPRLPVC